MALPGDGASSATARRSSDSHVAATNHDVEGLQQPSPSPLLRSQSLQGFQIGDEEGEIERPGPRSDPAAEERISDTVAVVRAIAISDVPPPEQDAWGSPEDARGGRSPCSLNPSRVRRAHRQGNASPSGSSCRSFSPVSSPERCSSPASAASPLCSTRPRTAARSIALFPAEPKRGFSATIEGERGRRRRAARGPWYFPSIFEALAAAKEGDTVLLQAGVYQEREALRMDVPRVSLVSAGTGEVVLESDWTRGALLEVSAMGASVRGIRFQQIALKQESEEGRQRERGEGEGSASPLASCKTRRVLEPSLEAHPASLERSAGRAMSGRVLADEWADGVSQSTMDYSEAAVCVHVSAGNADISECMVTGLCGIAVLITGDANPRIAKCNFEYCQGTTLLLCDRAAPVVEGNLFVHNSEHDVIACDRAGGRVQDNEFSFSGRAAILACDRASTTVVSNAIHDSLQGAIWLQGAARCAILSNVASANAKTHIQVSQSAAPTVEDNVLMEGLGGGIVVHDSAGGLYRRNEIRRNAQAGLGIIGDAAPVLVRNIVRENRKGGIAIAGQACPVLEGNDVSDNLLHGVGDTAMAVVEECRIEGNRQGGICSTCESSTRLVSNRIFAGSAAQQPIGVVVRSRSHSVLEKCEVAGHPTVNVVVRDDAHARLEYCRVADSCNGGLMIQNRAEAEMAHNEVRGNGLCNIGAMDHAIVWCQDSSITDSPGVGLLLLGSSSGSCRYNHISGNAKAGVRCTGETRVTVEHNRVHGTSRGNGITIDGRTTVRVHKNVVDGNQGCALSAGDRCAPTVSSNVLVCGSGPHASALLLSGRAGGRLRDNTVQVSSAQAIEISARVTARLSRNAVVSHSTLSYNLLETAVAALTVRATQECLCVMHPGDDFPCAIALRRPSCRPTASIAKPAPLPIPLPAASARAPLPSSSALSPPSLGVHPSSVPQPATCTAPRSREPTLEATARGRAAHDLHPAAQPAAQPGLVACGEEAPFGSRVQEIGADGSAGARGPKWQQERTVNMQLDGSCCQERLQQRCEEEGGWGRAEQDAAAASISAAGDMSPRNGFSAGAACAPLVASLTSSTSQGGSSVRDEGAEPSSDGGSTAERAEEEAAAAAEEEEEDDTDSASGAKSEGSSGGDPQCSQGGGEVRPGSERKVGVQRPCRGEGLTRLSGAMGTRLDSFRTELMLLASDREVRSNLQARRRFLEALREALEELQVEDREPVEGI